MNIGTREDLSVLRFRKGGSTQYFTSGILAVSAGSYFIDSSYLYAIPFFVAKTEKFDRIAINVISAGAAGKKARLGIYADDGTTAPGRLVLDAGEVAVDAAAVVEIAILQELLGGNLYWLALISNSTPTLQLCSVGTFYLSLLGLSSTLGTAWFTGYERFVAYGPLPDPFGAPTAISGSPCAIFLRKV